MSQTITSRLIAALVAGGLPVMTLAQDDPNTGGLRLTFDLSQRFDATTNDDLTDTDTTRQQSATTRVSAALISETRSERLSFNLSTGVLLENGDVSATDPSLALAYQRRSTGAQLDVTANWSQSRFETLRDLGSFIQDDGSIDLPDGLTDLTGDGTRTARSAGATLRWGQTAPIGASLGFTVSDLRYDGVGSGDLADSRSASVTGGLQFTLTPVSRADVTLRYGRTDDGDISDTTRLSATYTHDRPRGALTATLSATRDDGDDTRLGLSFGRRYALPEGALNASLGISENADGDPALTGRIGWQQRLPNGQISLNLSQAVASGTDADTDTTTLRGSYTHTLSPLSNLNLSFDYARASDPDDVLTTGSLSASLGYQITPDWQMNVGATHSLRDTQTNGRTEAQTLFLSLNRNLSVRP